MRSNTPIAGICLGLPYQVTFHKRYATVNFQGHAIGHLLEDDNEFWVIPEYPYVKYLSPRTAAKDMCSDYWSKTNPVKTTGESE